VRKARVDLYGNEWSEHGLVCPVCEREEELEAHRSRLNEVTDALEFVGRQLAGPVHGRLQTARGMCADERPYGRIDSYLQETDDEVRVARNRIDSALRATQGVKR